MLVINNLWWYEYVFLNHALNVVPFAVAQMVFLWWYVRCNDRATTIVNAEDQRTIDHLQEKEVAATVYGHQDTRRAARLDFHSNINIQAHTEVFH